MDPELARAPFEKAVRRMAICNAWEIDATTVQYAEIPDALECNHFYAKIGDYKIQISSGKISPEEIYSLLQQVRGNE